jgi:hypothetical protein
MAGRSNNFNDIPEKREEASKLAREALEYANGTIESFLDHRDRALVLNDGFLDTFLSSENFKDFSWVRLLVKERPVQVFQILKSRKLI